MSRIARERQESLLRTMEAFGRHTTLDTLDAAIRLCDGMVAFANTATACVDVLRELRRLTAEEDQQPAQMEGGVAGTEKIGGT